MEVYSFYSFSNYFDVYFSTVFSSIAEILLDFSSLVGYFINEYGNFFVTLLELRILKLLVLAKSKKLTTFQVYWMNFRGLLFFSHHRSPSGCLRQRSGNNFLVPDI